MLPWATLALALLLMAGALVQVGDRAARERAWAHYFASPLPTVELPRYAAHLERRSDAQSAQVLRAIRGQPDADGLREIVGAMQQDREFMRELRGGVVVRRDEPGYAAWREQRDRYESLLGQVVSERHALAPASVDVPRLFTHGFLHGGALALLANLLALLLAGPFVEAALGRWRFVGGVLVSAALGGAAHLLADGGVLLGAWGGVAGVLGMTAVLYGASRVPFWLPLGPLAAWRVPPLAVLPFWLLLAGVVWFALRQEPAAPFAVATGFTVGAIYAWLVRPDERLAARSTAARPATVAPSAAERSSTLLTEARQAAARLDTKRAARAYSELLQDDPTSTQYAAAYFNMALQGRDKDVLADAALRALWIRTRNARTELRPIYTQMSLPHVLAVLPIDEQLRLARRLVATREDAAALRVLDRLLGDATTRNLYGRQIADCLLGLFTTYSRHGLKAQADSVKTRLSQHFSSPATLGGAAPTREPPLTIRGATTRGATRGNPATVPASDLELDLDTRMHTRWD